MHRAWRAATGARRALAAHLCMFAAGAARNSIISASLHRVWRACASIAL